MSVPCGVADSLVLADVDLWNPSAEVSTAMSLLGWALVSLAAIWSAALLGAYCGIAAFFLLRERPAKRPESLDKMPIPHGVDAHESGTARMPADAC